MMQPAKIWSLTATDPTAGAGALADVKVAQRLGCTCEVVIIAITAQNSQGAQAVFPLPIEVIDAQWRSLQQDGWPAVIRLGWLPFSAPFLQWLLAALYACPARVIWDPVLSASQGSALSQDWQADGISSLWQCLLRRVDLITPNWQEAQRLSGEKNAEQAATALQHQGAQHVLIKGIDNQESVLDYFQFSQASSLAQDELPGSSLLRQFYLQQGRLNGSRHGTGCHFAASLACAVAQGMALYDALIQASSATRLYLRHQAQAMADDWPLVHSHVRAPLHFKPLETELGLYGLVDNLAHLKRLLALGIDSLQWRVKHPDARYAQDTQQAIRLCRAANVPLFINDDWRLAIALDADGVHLGQEDLNQADLAAIANAGLHLGISTHGDWELARARALNPSYIALGPIFAPLSKTLRYSPLGAERVSHYVRTFAAQHFTTTRFTTIGGITEANASCVWATGIGSIAVVTALADDAGLAQRMAQLQYRQGLPAHVEMLD